MNEYVQDIMSIRFGLGYPGDGFRHHDPTEIMKTGNPEMREVFSKILSVAQTRSTVLLTGETGTGKSLLARLIHLNSNRRDKGFIRVHCGAIMDTLVESELFGYEKGAFTGAVRKKRGKFEIAHKGTIFLDEIDTLTPSAQIKILQVLQDGTLQRVGGEETIGVDVRVISATNADLQKMCNDGQFRKDLFYRLNVFPIEIPPLRKRTEDIPRLTGLFLKRLNRNGKKDINAVATDVMESFIRYHWPGNIREMENAMERAYIMETSDMLTSRNFPGEIVVAESPSSHSGPFLTDCSRPISEVRRKAVETVENAYLRKLLKKNHGKIKETALNAGITPRQIHKLIRKYDIERKEFRTGDGTTGRIANDRPGRA